MPTVNRSSVDGVRFSECASSVELSQACYTTPSTLETHFPIFICFLFIFEVMGWNEEKFDHVRCIWCYAQFMAAGRTGLLAYLHLGEPQLDAYLLDAWW
jgi:hypothetical protein